MEILNQFLKLFENFQYLQWNQIAMWAIGGLLIFLAIAYINGGTSAPTIGGVGLSAMALTGASLYTAIRGFREREKDYLTCKIGLAASALLILSFVGIFCRGLF